MINEQFIAVLDDKKALHVLLVEFAKIIGDRYSNKYDFEFDDEVFAEAADSAVIKSYKLKKHLNALNFFTTITMCFLRQIVRSHKSTEYIERKFHEKNCSKSTSK